MKTTVKSLQGLYVELGGSLTDTYETIANGIPVGNYVTIPDMIEAVAQKAPSGGGGGSSLPSVTTSDNGDVLTVVAGKWEKAEPVEELPEVSASDNGDVLTVVEGAWAKAAAPSGNALLVTFTASGGVYSADKTLAEINDAWATNKNILGYNAETGYVMPCVLVNQSVALFSAVALISANTFAGMAMQITADSVTYEQETLENAQS